MIMSLVDPGRRTVIDLGRRVSATLFALLVLGCCYLAPRFWEQSHPPLDATTLAIPREAQGSWLAAGRVPQIEELAGSTMARDALLDLNALSRPHGVPVAGWAPAWQYVWPRDVAFAASAFARTGHFDDAKRILQFLQGSQPTSGTFEARYRPDGSGPPDHRGIQLDGSGWAIWALDQVAAELPTASQRRELITGFQPLLDRSTAAILRSVRDGSTLPPPSPDYWERPERRVTLATCSVLLAGLRSAERLYQTVGQLRPALSSVTDRFEQTVVTTFAPDGFPRHPGGPPRTVDLGVAFLLRPFAGVTDPSAVQAWRRSPTFMRRPAGGLAPGGSWRRDGISWTPTVASYAMVEACEAPRERAVARLRWLDQHRTTAGSLPEKVRADGSPASVAPVTWTAAAVVITVDELERGCSTTGR
jgi:glucoamylase